MLRARRNIEKIVDEKMGIMLSDYVTMHIPIAFMCKMGHIWETQPRTIHQGSWCPECARIPQHVKDKFEEIVVRKGGKLITPYVRAKEPITIDCGKDHIWVTTPCSINDGSWCRYCAGHDSDASRLNFYEEVELKGGSVVGNYTTNHTPVEVMCDQSHTWFPTPANIKSGHWCMECSDKCPKKAEAKLVEIVSAKQGKLLSNYTNALQKLSLSCKKGHIWFARPNCIRNGHWCPRCRESKGEQEVSKVLDDLSINYTTQYRLPGTGLRFDFMVYIGEDRVLIEYDGEQHFRFSDFFHNDETHFQYSQERDITKTLWALENGIPLIRIAYTQFDQIKDIISAQVYQRNLYLSDQEIYSYIAQRLPE